MILFLMLELLACWIKTLGFGLGKEGIIIWIGQRIVEWHFFSVFWLCVCVCVCWCSDILFFSSFVKEEKYFFFFCFLAFEFLFSQERKERKKERKEKNITSLTKEEKKMTFQRWILVIFIIGLLISAIIFSYSIRSTIKKKKWPPVIANCPDYWIDQTGDGSKCVSVSFNESNGSSCSGTVDFSNMNLCQKYKQMQKCKTIIWEGVTHSNPDAKQCQWRKGP